MIIDGYNDFDINTYRKNNADLTGFTDEQLIEHFNIHGRNEPRIWQKEYEFLTDNITNFNQFYPKFNIDVYRDNNYDLSNKNEQELMIHYHVFGRFSTRKCEIETIKEEDNLPTVPFYYNLYLKEVTDENLYNADRLQKDYHKNININYKNNINLLLSLNIPFEQYDYFYKLNDYIKLYYSPSERTDTTKIYNDLIKNTKIEFRYFCFRYLDYIRTLPIKDIKLGLDKETVLIEMRPFPHLEFTLRNMIAKLPNNWSHTVICGNLNYKFVKDMCSKISPNINIIHINYDNLDPSSYSKVLSSEDFWNNLTGEKILIYQEDACIFKSNINDFLKYDYIGAPWPLDQNDNKNLVGNGGFSLRSKSVMLKVIDKINIYSTQYSSHTLEYIRHTQSYVPPEDVYFSKNIIDHKLGNVAPHNIAQKFSVETIYNENPFGGHNFHISIKNWKEHMYKHVVKQSYTNIDFKMLEHRCGWSWILSHLMKNDLIIQFKPEDDLSKKIFFVDTLEKHFMWEKRGEITIPWLGFIHCTNIAPSYLQLINIDSLFEDVNFIKSLKNCKVLFTLSTYLLNYVNGKLVDIGIEGVKVKMVEYSCFDDGVIDFDWIKFIKNKEKKLLQLGQQLRIVTSIYRIKTIYKKIWMGGTKNLEHLNMLFKNEKEMLKITENIDINDIELKYTDDYDEFDKLLSENIVFLNLFDASANTTVIECIVRNTPIIINRLEAVEEYLGKDYPLYFDNLSEVEGMLKNTHRLHLAHMYLQKMDKSSLKIEKLVKMVGENMYC